MCVTAESKTYKVSKLLDILALREHLLPCIAGYTRASQSIYTTHQQ